MEDSEIAQQIAAKQAYGQAVCDNMAQCIAKLGFPEDVNIKIPQFSEAEFSLLTDPYTQSRDLVGYWYDANKQRIGQIKFNCEDGFYAEYDVVLPHPRKKGFFVEAINAWGKQDNIRSEAKLLDIPQ
jgi:hypothetical protein